MTSLSLLLQTLCDHLLIHFESNPCLGSFNFDYTVFSDKKKPFVF